jgi:hypothetical protein
MSSANSKSKAAKELPAAAGVKEQQAACMHF